MSITVRYIADENGCGQAIVATGARGPVLVGRVSQREKDGLWFAHSVRVEIPMRKCTGFKNRAEAATWLLDYPAYAKKKTVNADLTDKVHVSGEKALSAVMCLPD